MCLRMDINWRSRATDRTLCEIKIETTNAISFKRATKGYKQEFFQAHNYG